MYAELNIHNCSENYLCRRAGELWGGLVNAAADENGGLSL